MARPLLDELTTRYANLAGEATASEAIHRLIFIAHDLAVLGDLDGSERAIKTLIVALAEAEAEVGIAFRFHAAVVEPLRPMRVLMLKRLGDA